MGSSIIIWIISEFSIIYLFYIGHYVERNTIYVKYKCIHHRIAILKVNNTSNIFQNYKGWTQSTSKCLYILCVTPFSTSMKDFLKLKIGFYTSSNSKLHRHQAAFAGCCCFKDVFQCMYYTSHISKSESMVCDSANSFVETVICVSCNICT